MHGGIYIVYTWLANLSWVSFLTVHLTQEIIFSATSLSLTDFFLSKNTLLWFTSINNGSTGPDEAVAIGPCKTGISSNFCLIPSIISFYSSITADMPTLLFKNMLILLMGPSLVGISVGNFSWGWMKGLHWEYKSVDQNFYFQIFYAFFHWNHYALHPKPF